MSFQSFRLTEKEKRERAHKKELLRIAKEHEQAREIERIQRYHMPHEKKKGEPEQDYADREPPQSEQSKWESDQMSSAVFKFGAKNKKGNSNNRVVINVIVIVIVVLL